MKHYISQARAMYEDYYHGLFSKKLAEWAISNMRGKDGKSINAQPLDEVKLILEAEGVNLPADFDYTAWYLYNMAIADYPETLTNDHQRAMFVKVTINDPDSSPDAVLECFVAKMTAKGEPIFWEKYL